MLQPQSQHRCKCDPQNLQLAAHRHLKSQETKSTIFFIRQHPRREFKKPCVVTCHLWLKRSLDSFFFFFGLENTVWMCCEGLMQMKRDSARQIWVTLWSAFTRVEVDGIVSNPSKPESDTRNSNQSGGSFADLLGVCFSSLSFSPLTLGGFLLKCLSVQFQNVWD